MTNRISILLRCEICKTEKRIKARTDIMLDHLIKSSGWDSGDTKAYHDYCPKCKHLATQESLF